MVRTCVSTHVPHRRSVTILSHVDCRDAKFGYSEGGWRIHLGLGSIPRVFQGCYSYFVLDAKRDEYRRLDPCVSNPILKGRDKSASKPDGHLEQGATRHLVALLASSG